MKLEEKLKKQDLIALANEFDSNAYPIELYKSIVIDQLPIKNRLLYIGSWKAGCVRKASGQYQDFVVNGIRYEFTKNEYRIKVWKSISKQEKQIEKSLNGYFPFQKPKYLKDLISKNVGIDFVYGVFILHCFNPENFPLFDQHVYRAYKFLNFEKDSLNNLAPKSWDAYREYRNFFLFYKDKMDIDYWELDRALWVFGKELTDKKSNDASPKIKKKTSIQTREIYEREVVKLDKAGKVKKKEIAIIAAKTSGFEPAIYHIKHPNRYLNEIRRKYNYSTKPD